MEAGILRVGILRSGVKIMPVDLLEWPARSYYDTVYLPGHGCVVGRASSFLGETCLAVPWFGNQKKFEVSNQIVISD